MALFSPNITGASRSLRVLARLLSYPDAQLRGDLNDMRQALVAERALPTARLAELGALMSTLETGNALENEAEYVEVFDRGRATSLHLFEHGMATRAIAARP
jgi:nitrate reductase delta subunit